MGLFRGLKIDPRALPLLLAAASLLLNGCVPEDTVSKSTVKPPQATAPARNAWNAIPNPSKLTAADDNIRNFAPSDASQLHRFNNR